MSGLPVRFLAAGASRRGHSCGDGCYTAVVPLIGGRPRLAVSAGTAGRVVRLGVPASWPAPGARAILRRVESTWRGLRSLTAVTRIASDPQHEVTTRWLYRAPDRVSYNNLPNASQAILIGRRRWDRSSAGGRWQESAQDPVRQPAPPWSKATADAHVIGSATAGRKRLLRISFVDRTGPAWFTILVDPVTARTMRVDMIAQSHFMRQDNSQFDTTAAIQPPSR